MVLGAGNNLFKKLAPPFGCFQETSQGRAINILYDQRCGLLGLSVMPEGRFRGRGCRR